MSSLKRAFPRISLSDPNNAPYILTNGKRHLMMINWVDVSLFRFRSASLSLGQLINAMSSSQAQVEELSVSERGLTESEPCQWITNRTCPDPEVRFYLFTRSNADERQLIHVDDTWDASNLSSSFFNPKQPSKIIIHGFRADMFLTPLFRMKTGRRTSMIVNKLNAKYLPEYLQRDSYNVFFVDWFNLSSSFCYPAVVHNIKHVGACTAQLVNRIRDAGGGEDVHVIGFSLGAQVTNYVANSLKPDYRLPRITGKLLQLHFPCQLCS